jgi:hypothetical protein
MILLYNAQWSRTRDKKHEGGGRLPEILVDGAIVRPQGCHSGMVGQWQHMRVPVMHGGPIAGNSGLSTGTHCILSSSARLCRDSQEITFDSPKS